MHFLDEIVAQALNLQTPDTHIAPPSPGSQHFYVAFRRQRHTVARQPFPQQGWAQLRSYLQFHSGYNYENNHLFQDKMLEYNNHVLRLAFTPGRDPYITLRMASNKEIVFDKSDGVSKFWEHWDKHGGLLLIAGPIHSGKTTLYYEMLERSAHAGATLSSWEDPIEQLRPHLNQHLLPSQRWGELATAALRFDWDVLGVGEVRDVQHIEHLLFLSLSSVRTITTIHARSLVALRYKIDMLPPLVREQFSELISGVLFRQHHTETLQWVADV